ncbi:hypothetical protein H920_08594 [Fukomys damarensis]|uniref:Uncharacterized protein n=1 Tax=Fukomys damarensis TaxID=885580 RepID=A0A091E4G0_FUKDA|nr:hypothetical protein H920_08594 [Fukomys damarensis]
MNNCEGFAQAQEGFFFSTGEAKEWKGVVHVNTTPTRSADQGSRTARRAGGWDPLQPSDVALTHTAGALNTALTSEDPARSMPTSAKDVQDDQGTPVMHISPRRSLLMETLSLGHRFESKVHA